MRIVNKAECFMKIKSIYKVFSIALVFFSLSAMANATIFPPGLVLKPKENCSVANDDTPTFCTDFKNTVQSCCPIGKLPMQDIYHLAISTYGNLQNACAKEAAQYGGTVQACIDQWNCYWNGGEDSEGNLCDADGKACDTL